MYSKISAFWILLVGFFGEKAQILHTWKIQVFETTTQ